MHRLPRAAGPAKACRGAASAALQSGPTVKAQLSNTLGYYVSAQARRLGHKNAFRVPHQGVAWTYIDVKKNVEALAVALYLRGVKCGDRVLSIQQTAAEQWMLQLACAKVGAVHTPISPYTLTLEGLDAALRTVQPSAIVVREFCEVAGADGAPKRRSTHEILYQAIPEMDQAIGSTVQPITSKDYPSVRNVYSTDFNENLVGTVPLRQILRWGPFDYYQNPLRPRARLIHADSPCLMLHDADKVVVYTHRNVMTAGYHAARHLKLDSDTRVGMAPGLGDSPGGTIVASHAALAAGASMSLCGEHLFHESHVGGFLENVEIERLQGLFVSKQQLALLQSAVQASPDGVGQLRWVCIVDEEVDAATVEEAKAVFKVDTVHTFGGPPESAHALWHGCSNGSEVRSVAPNAAVRGAEAKGPGIASQRWTAGGLVDLQRSADGFVALS